MLTVIVESTAFNTNAHFFVLFMPSAIVFLCVCLVSFGPTLGQQTDFESFDLVNAVRQRLLSTTVNKVIATVTAETTLL